MSPITVAIATIARPTLSAVCDRPNIGQYGETEARQWANLIGTAYSYNGTGRLVRLSSPPMWM